MSGSVVGYFYNENNVKCDFSTAITNTEIVYGKNQPFLQLEITVSKYMFDSLAYWKKRLNDYTITACPKPVQNSTIIHVETYGGTYDLLYTQAKNPNESTYIFMCYSKEYLLKNIDISSLLGNITWNPGAGNSNPSAHYNGSTTLTYNDIDGTTLSTFVDLSGAPNGTQHQVGMHWNNIYIISPSGIESHLGRSKSPYATVTKGKLRILVPIYTDSTLPTSTTYITSWDSSTGYSFGDNGSVVNPDPRTVYASVVFEYTLPLTHIKIYKADDKDSSGYGYNVRYSEDKSTTYKIQTYNSTTKKMVETTSTNVNSLMYCTGIEYICGYTQAIFSWMAHKVSGYTGNIQLDPAFRYRDYMDLTSEQIPNFTRYVKANLDTLKSQKTELTTGDIVCKFSPTSNCYSTLSSMGSLTNRAVWFADTPYFTNGRAIIASSSDPAWRTETPKAINLFIKYVEGSTEDYYAYAINQKTLVKTPIDLSTDIVYNDQGSTYLVSSQSASSPQFEYVTTLTDSGSDKDGTPITMDLATDEDILDTKRIVAQTSFNELCHNYEPGSTLSFSVYENDSVSPSYVAYMVETTNESKLPTLNASVVGKYFVKYGTADIHLYLGTYSDNTYSWTAVTPSSGDICLVYTTFKIYRMEYNGSAWVELTDSSVVQRSAIFKPNIRAQYVYDARSGLTLKDVPIAYTTLSWPASDTTYMFGDPFFQDTEQTLSDMQELVSNAVSTTTASSTISNSNYTTIALGSSTSETSASSTPTYVSADDLATYSGVLIQKNSSTGVANIDGYDNGQRQARFSSAGSISCGTVTYTSPRTGEVTEAGDSVVMNRNGFTTRSWHLYASTEIEYDYKDGYWQDECTIGVDGTITAGEGSVKLNSDGLITYNTSGDVQCTIGTDGKISAGSGAVILDSAGLTTYNASGVAQVSIGTNGAIVAGGGNTKISSAGFETYDSAGNRVCYVDTSGNIHGVTVEVESLSADKITTGLINASQTITIGTEGALYSINGGVISYNGEPLIVHNSTGNYDEINLYVDVANIKGTIVADNVVASGIKTGTIDSSQSIYIGTEGQRFVINGNTISYEYGSTTTPIITTDGKINLNVDAAKVSGKLTAATIDASQINSSAISANTITLSDSGKIVAGSETDGAVLSKDGLKVVGDNNSISVGNYTLNSTGLSHTNGTTTTPIITDGYITEALLTADNIKTGKLSANVIAAGSLDATKITSGTITATQLSSGAVTAEKIASNTITSEQIASNAITANELSANAVTTAKLDANAVTADKIASHTITADQIATNYVYAGQVRADQIYTDDVSTNYLDAGVIKAGTLNGDKITSNTITATQLQAGAVTADAISANAVTSVKLDTGAVTADKIGAEAVTTVKLDANAVTADKIGASAVTTDKLDANAVTAEKIASHTITANQIATDYVYAGTIETSQLKTGQLTSQDITLNGGSLIAGGTTLDKAGLTTKDASSNITARLTSTGLFAVGGAGNATMRTYDGKIYFYPKGSYIQSSGGVYTAQSGGTAVTPTAWITDDGTVMGLAIGSVTEGTVATGAITETKISNDAITTPKIKALAITGAKIAAGTITADNIEAHTITANEIKAGTITATEISSAYIYAGDIVADQIKSGTLKSVVYENLDDDDKLRLQIDTTGTLYANYGYITSKSSATGEPYVPHTVIGESGIELRGYTADSSSIYAISYWLPNSYTATSATWKEIGGTDVYRTALGTTGAYQYVKSDSLNTTSYSTNTSDITYARQNITSIGTAQGSLGVVSQKADASYSISVDGATGSTYYVGVYSSGSSSTSQINNTSIGITKTPGEPAIMNITGIRNVNVSAGSTYKGNLNIYINAPSSSYSSSVTATYFHGLADSASTASTATYSKYFIDKSNTSTIAIADSTWAGGRPDSSSIRVWGQKWTNSAYSTDTADFDLWLNKESSTSTTINLAVDGRVYALLDLNCNRDVNCNGTIYWSGSLIHKDTGETRGYTNATAKSIRYHDLSWRDKNGSLNNGIVGNSYYSYGTTSDGTAVAANTEFNTTNVYNGEERCETYLRAFMPTTSGTTSTSLGLGYKATITNGGTIAYTAYTFAPTPSATDNSTNIATTAFVKSLGYTTNTGTVTTAGTGLTLSSDKTTLSVTANTYAPYNSNGYLPLNGGTLTGALSGTSASFTGAVSSGTSLSAQSIELKFTTPFIDFHYNNSTADYTSRIIESASGTLSINSNTFSSSAVSIPGTLSVTGALSGTTASFSTSLTLPCNHDTTFAAKGIYDITSATHLNWSTYADYLVTNRTLAYWNGRYNASASNLAYCNKGAFGDVVTHSNSEYWQIGADLGSSYTMAKSDWNQAYPVRRKVTSFASNALSPDGNNIGDYYLYSLGHTDTNGYSTVFAVTPRKWGNSGTNANSDVGIYVGHFWAGTWCGWSRVGNRRCAVGHSGNTTTYKWYKVASYVTSTNYDDQYIRFYVTTGVGSDNASGILDVHVRTNQYGWEQSQINWELCGPGITRSYFVLLHSTAGSSSASNFPCTFELWAYMPSGYTTWHFEVLSEGDRYKYFTNWVLYNNVTDSAIDGQVASEYTSGLTAQTSGVLKQAINISGTADTSTLSTESWDTIRHDRYNLKQVMWYNSGTAYAQIGSRLFGVGADGYYYLVARPDQTFTLPFNGGRAYTNRTVANSYGNAQKSVRGVALTEFTNLNFANTANLTASASYSGIGTVYGYKYVVVTYDSSTKSITTGTTLEIGKPVYVGGCLFSGAFKPLYSTSDAQTCTIPSGQAGFTTATSVSCSVYTFYLTQYPQNMTNAVVGMDTFLYIGQADMTTTTLSIDTEKSVAYTYGSSNQLTAIDGRPIGLPVNDASSYTINQWYYTSHPMMVVINGEDSAKGNFTTMSLHISTTNTGSVSSATSIGCNQSFVYGSSTHTNSIQVIGYVPAGYYWGYSNNNNAAVKSFTVNLG